MSVLAFIAAHTEYLAGRTIDGDETKDSTVHSKRYCWELISRKNVKFDFLVWRRTPYASANSDSRHIIGMSLRYSHQCIGAEKDLVHTKLMIKQLKADK